MLKRSCWWAGPSILTALLIALTAATSAQQGAPQRLAQRWAHPLRGSLPQAVVVDPRDDRQLFVALKQGGLAVLRAPEGGREPREVARLPVARFGGLHVMHLDLQGTTLYAALGDLFAARGSKAGLAAIDVRDAAHPVVLGTWASGETLGGAAAVAVRGRYAYLAAMSAGVMVFDVEAPAAIRHLTTVLPDPNFPRPNPTRTQRPNARGLALAGEHLYVANDAGGVRVLDLRDPAHPTESGRYVNAGMGTRQQAYNSLVVDGTLLYAAIDYAGVEVLDVSNPVAIRQVAWWNPWHAGTNANLWFNSPGHTNQLAFDAVRRLLYVSAGDSELQVVSVADPRQPSLVAVHGEPRNGRGVWGVTLGPADVYLTYITTLVPFRGTWSGLVSVEPAHQGASAGRLERGNIAGTWEATVVPPGLAAFHLRMEGEELTGTLRADDSPPVVVRNGRVRSADTITFEHVLPGGDGTVLLFIGRVEPAEMRLAVTAIRGPASTGTRNFSAVRVAP
ncbi:MAG: LVIVD repeat-containing protein [Vicinamibacterales bacterium]